MPGPGEYRPDPSQGITRIEDLPKPKIRCQSRNYRRRPCPRCGQERLSEPVRIFARALAWPLDFAGLWPFRPRPNPVRALSPSIYPDAAGAAPDLQKIVGQADQLPLGRHFLQASQ